MRLYYSYFLTVYEKIFDTPRTRTLDERHYSCTTGDSFLSLSCLGHVLRRSGIES